MQDEVIIDIENPKDNDLISRQAVLEKMVYTETEEGWWGYTVDVDYIKSLPSVTPQPKTGEWIGDAKTYYEELNKRGLGIEEFLIKIKQICKSEKLCRDCPFYKSGCYLGDLPCDWCIDEIVSIIDKE